MGGSFVYSNPPVIHWGPGSLQVVRGELARLGARHPALVTTRSVETNADLTSAVWAGLGQPASRVIAVIGQHAPVHDIEAAVAIVAASPADSIVSLGGGSPIDAAKIVAIQAAERRGSSGGRLPHLALPTTLSGAELAAGAGFTDQSGAKVGSGDPRGLPDLVVYDAELTVATPTLLWLSSGIRALDHAVEGYLAGGEHPLSDVLALEAVRRLFRTLPEARHQPEDLRVKTENQLAAWFSYTLPGPSANGLSHRLGKQIGARHGIPHGITSCLLMPHVMLYLAPRRPLRMKQLASATGDGGDPTSAADDVSKLIAGLGLPQRLGDFGLSEPDLRAAARALADGDHSAAELLAVYHAAL
ncbi:MAG: iron-containing alcohol dehydrogenase [Candidatus Dormibacteraeota bacterium]|nr:iron-containing alcohol dehydrogenase [Candidatus Dormibacteraeota bacterium]